MPARQPEKHAHDELENIKSATSEVSQIGDLPPQLVQGHSLSSQPGGGFPLPARLRDLETRLYAAHQRFSQSTTADVSLSSTSEWLLDNFYVVQQAIRQIREDMPEGYYRRLPRRAGLPIDLRIYWLALDYIRSSPGGLNSHELTRFVNAYQEQNTLTIGEVWAIPTMLRLGILDSLVQAIEIIDEATVANCILSLRMVATQDWKAFFETVNKVDRALRRDPLGIYPLMDFETRDHYRRVIEELALATGFDEERVAQEAVQLAQYSLSLDQGEEDSRQPPCTAHVGYFLVDAGRHQLEGNLGYAPPRRERLRRGLFAHANLAYLGSITLLTLLLLLGLVGYAFITGGTPFQLLVASLVTLFPASAVAINTINYLITHTIPPRLLPKMEFHQGVPAEFRTMVVIPALLRDVEEVKSLIQQLELHYLGNFDPHIHFALVTDFTDAPQKNMPNDEALLEAAKIGIQTLNKKYSQRPAGSMAGADSRRRRERQGESFYFFHRQRVWNPGENCWMGWERKRGKLAEFNRLFSGSKDTTFFVIIGDPSILSKIRYVITLDADTILPRGSARRLIATLAHPLNQAKFDPQSGAVVAGYTVLQPRIQIQPSSANQTIFTRIFSHDNGLDLYTRAVSDVYQDLFGEGIYVGKGIYDVDSFERSLEGKIPENALLSHDLFEGIHGRAGLVTDVILYEDYPPHYFAYMHRLHRWVRGDWQLLPWLFPNVPHFSDGIKPNGLSVLDRWKILDNLRRSLVAPWLLAMLIAGWLWLPGSALIWTAAGVLTLALPFLAQIRPGLARGTPGHVSAERERPAWAEAIHVLMVLAFIPYEAFVRLDAIFTTLARLLVTRKGLLQWTSAAHTVHLFGKEVKLNMAWRKMVCAPIFALLMAFLMILLNLQVLPVAAPLLAMWLASPYIAYRISRPITRNSSPLPAGEQMRLRLLARRTWLFFEEFVGPDDHWLPPDHFQEHPRGLVAHRTSPTNIGLLLLSTLAAHDFGYIGLLELSIRLRGTFDGMDALEKHSGHLLNWYDTRNLKALPPRYVSVVDSGNLAGCLLALKQGCLEIPRQPLISPQRLQGLLDALDILAETVGSAGPSEAVTIFLKQLAHFRQQVEEVINQPHGWGLVLVQLCGESYSELVQMVASLIEASQGQLDPSTMRGLHTWAERAHRHVHNLQRDLDLFIPWLSLLSQPPALFTPGSASPVIPEAWWELVSTLSTMPCLEEAPAVCKAGQACLARLQTLLTGEGELVQEARQWCVRLAQSLDEARMRAESLLIGFLDLSLQAERFFQGMEFGFLFNERRQVFHNGYNLDSGELDSNYYDLLASEARLASLLAIAKGEVPQNHWLYLARPLTLVDHTRALLSWSGSMFEYLMPSLLVDDYEPTLIFQSILAAVDRQIAYGRKKGIPWGISESGFYHFDANLNYQYRAFGVPGLGFKRDLPDDLVVSPHASLLALSLRPQAVIQNIEHLIDLKMLGNYGLYEAIDFTPARLSKGEDYAIVRSYMAHHQGMILLALANCLQDKAMIRRFHTDPQVRSVELLLQEQIPFQAPIEFLPSERTIAGQPVRTRRATQPWQTAIEAPVPLVHYLSNGRLGVLITNAGSGYSRYSLSNSKGQVEVNLTRWRADTTLDDWGTWIYAQDLDSGELWSAGYQPTASQSESHSVFFHPHKAEFQRRDHDISLHMEVTVPPDEDVEIRRITLTNFSHRHRRIRLTSYGEVVLAPSIADQRHPAFNKLFLESEFLSENNALLFRRRPRSSEEAPLYLAHLVVMEHENDPVNGYETDRRRFLGRGGTLRSPAALMDNGSQSTGFTGPTLDPIMSISREIKLGSRISDWEAYNNLAKPGTTVRMAYVTLVAESRQKAMDMVHRYQSWREIEGAFNLARSSSEQELEQFQLTSPKLELLQQLLSILLYPHHSLRAPPDIQTANRKGQPGLWPFAISGDYPILLVRISSQKEIKLVRDLIQAHAYWRSRGLKIDLVVLNLREAGYRQELHDQLHRLVTQTGSETWLNKRGGIFLLRASQMDEADRILLETTARAILDGRKDRLAEQLKVLVDQPIHLPRFVPTLPTLKEVESTPPLIRPSELVFDNELGGFTPDGREYVIYLEPGQWTPAPWINVIANPRFGFLVSEAGLGCTWAENSGENRLTPWRNDPVADTPGEALYLRDEDTGQVWSPTPLPAGDATPYLIYHGAGYTIFEHHSHGLKQHLRLFAVPDAPLKVAQLRLENMWKRTRRINVTYFAEWVLGTRREDMAQYIVPEFETSSYALLARNTYNNEFNQRVAFLTSTRTLHGLTADRTEFLGPKGSYRHPAALERMGLTGIVKPGLDPCAAMQVLLWLAPGETKEVTFLLGQGADRTQADRLIRQYKNISRVTAAWNSLTRFWDELLSKVSVQTPDPAMNLLLNRWLLYQTLSCRIWGRSALYQSNGAFGFRDQLQDVMALVHAEPDLYREHILRAARHQFEEGDVLHWWHPPSGRGVRTRCSDDLLWLPYVTAHYVTATGDTEILNERVPFLEGEPLEEGEAERYGLYVSNPGLFTLYEHCLRAVNKGTTSGPHDLPLIGSHDWNDGLNRVGIAGRGESVWLGWFLYTTLDQFSAICELMGNQDQAARYRRRAKELRQAIEASAWDGEWYLRAFYDDETLLGSAQNEECQIDSIAQSWAVLSGAANPARAVQAMESVANRLVRWEDQLLLLFTPPFDQTVRDTGYIKGYHPGVRENGGQYTHAALWSLWAFTKLGQGDRAEALFRLINPIYHSETPEKASRYQVEPYVVAADVYSTPQHIGHGGWTWYTGSAGWMYRLGLEAILGLRRVGNALRISPCIPKNWKKYRLTYRYEGTIYDFQVENPAGVNKGIKQVNLDGIALRNNNIPLISDGKIHKVHILMG